LLVERCRSPDAPGVIPTIYAVAHMTFAPDGTVSSVILDEPVGHTALGDCVEAALRPVVIPPFDGDPVPTVKSFGFH
jgi:hypothetical protein